MVARAETESQNVAVAASQLLHAWRNGRRLSLEPWNTQVWDALERERMEVLESVVESLKDQPTLSSDKIRVAVRLLEHLAQGPAELPQD